MIFPELQIQFDLNPDNRVNVLKNADTCRLTDVGYLFIDSEDGQCYLFDKDGNLDDIRKVKDINWEFEDCRSLKSIEIPNSVETIGSYAFWGCTSLASIKIPNSVESIGDWAFEFCLSLKDIKIPNSVESIGDSAFIGCTSLKELVFEGKTMKQVKAMNSYPWGIEDTIIIKAES